MSEMAPEAEPLNVQIIPSWSDGVFQIATGLEDYVSVVINYAQGAEALIPSILAAIVEHLDETHEAIVEAVEAGQLRTQGAEDA